MTPDDGVGDDRPCGDGLRRHRAQLTPGPKAVAAARAFVRETLTGWAVPELACGDAILCTNELVASSVVHSAGAVSLELTARHGEVQLAVLTNGPSLPTAPSPTERLGRLIVAALVDDWGEHLDEGGGRGMWCRLRFQPRSS